MVDTHMSRWDEGQIKKINKTTSGMVLKTGHGPIPSHWNCEPWERPTSACVCGATAEPASGLCPQPGRGPRGISQHRYRSSRAPNREHGPWQATGEDGDVMKAPRPGAGV